MTPDQDMPFTALAGVITRKLFLFPSTKVCYLMRRITNA